MTAACGGKTTTELVAPSPTSSRCQIAVTTPASAMPASGVTISLDIVVARECAWTAAADAPWLVVSPTSGQGNASVTVAAAANEQARARSAALVVNDARVVLAQDPAECTFDLASTSARVGSEGGRVSLRVSTIDECEWRVAGSASWVRVLTDGGVGASVVEMDVDRNVGSERSTGFSIAGLPFEVRQDAEHREPSPLPVPACTIAIDPPVQGYGPVGGEGSFRVTVAAGCGWQAFSTVDWVVIGQSRGTGNGVLSYRVLPNVLPRDRSGTITIGGRTHLVVQQALGQS